MSSGTVAKPPATSSATVAEFDDSRFDCSIDDDLTDEDIQRAYKEMYSKWKKLQETKLHLENTQKSLRMLNSDTAKLDHIRSIGKSSRDHHGLGYTGESSSSKTVFVRGTVRYDF
ncbi:hypothetical protein TIFTF001_014081 [Ficus carica]|uniref:Uncharacterized protein n=1 Tax=Ficus carica TaxID=3494 RepID=A0AA88A239_FICCA|nr:hypothetical protein TIFTF001_014081 [Ficus carica]